MERHYYAGICAALAKCETERFGVKTEIHAFDRRGNLHRITFEWSKRGNRGWIWYPEIHASKRITICHLNPPALRKACERLLRGEPWAGLECTERFRMSHIDYYIYLYTTYGNRLARMSGN